MNEPDFKTWREMYAAACNICEKHNRSISMTVMCMTDHPTGHPKSMEFTPEQYGAKVRIYRMSGYDRVTVSSADVSKRGAEEDAVGEALLHAFREAFGVPFLTMCEMHGIRPIASPSVDGTAVDVVAAAYESGRRDGETAVKNLTRPVFRPAFGLHASESQTEPATDQAIVADSASEATEGQVEACGGQEEYSRTGGEQSLEQSLSLTLIHEVERRLDITQGHLLEIDRRISKAEAVIARIGDSARG